jgi:hypothetical protein
MHMPFEQGPIRPPSEAESLLLRLTRNCPWNRCTFCPVYKGRKFSKRPVDDILSDIDEVAGGAERVRELSWRMGCGGEVTRSVAAAVLESAGTGPAEAAAALWLYHGRGSVFLQDSDALVLPHESLIRILEHLRSALPGVKRVTCYSRSATLARRKPGKLTEIRMAGLDRVHVGMESGSDRVLELARKGATSRLHIEGGLAALQAGLELSEYVMPGLGGEALSREHALESARVITAISPHFTRLRSLGIRRGTPLRLMAEGGRFSPLDDDALVAEIRLLVEHLEGAHTRLVSDHILNLLGELEGRLPEELPALLGILDAYLDLPDHERELFRLGRRAGLLHSTSDLGRPGLRSAVEQLSRQVGDMGRSVGDICAELLEKMI